MSGENDRDVWFRWRDGIMIVNLIHESGNGNALRPRRPTPFPLLEKGAKEHFLHGTRQRKDRDTLEPVRASFLPLPQGRAGGRGATPPRISFGSFSLCRAKKMNEHQRYTCIKINNSPALAA